MATRATGPTTARTPVQTVSMIFGVVFLLVGVLGFIPGITPGAEELSFAGPGSAAMLLGIFHVSVLHNIVHLLFGVAGIAMARTPGNARNYLVVSGVIYAVLTIYGLLVPADGEANFVPVNTADNWLHLVLTIGLLGAGLALGPRGARR